MWEIKVILNRDGAIFRIQKANTVIRLAIRKGRVKILHKNLHYVVDFMCHFLFIVWLIFEIGRADLQ